jgi:hypothetical protein
LTPSKQHGDGKERKKKKTFIAFYIVSVINRTMSFSPFLSQISPEMRGQKKQKKKKKP